MYHLLFYRLVQQSVFYFFRLGEKPAVTQSATNTIAIINTICTALDIFLTCLSDMLIVDVFPLICYCVNII